MAVAYPASQRDQGETVTPDVELVCAKTDAHDAQGQTGQALDSCRMIDIP